MSEEISEQLCQCQCGSSKFTVKGEPIARIFCHCRICQEFNDAAFADVTIFLSKDVHLHDANNVAFKKHKSPPAIQRGKCTHCEKPAIELLELPLFPGLTIIPSENIPAGRCLPKPLAHIFYHRRLVDSSDALPKHSGFLKSQLALSAKLLPEIFRRFVSA